MLYALQESSNGSGSYFDNTIINFPSLPPPKEENEKEESEEEKEKEELKEEYMEGRGIVGYF